MNASSDMFTSDRKRRGRRINLRARCVKRESKASMSKEKRLEGAVGRPQFALYNAGEEWYVREPHFELDLITIKGNREKRGLDSRD